MILIGGLGNPGKEYEQTRHNIGFMVLDALADRLNLVWRKQADLHSEIIKDNEHILFKPQTFVNASGQAALAVQQFYKVEDNEIWIVHDDTEIPFGEVRVKMGGSSGGHNGIKSIDNAIGAKYWRVRVGVGRPEDHRYDLADYVLEAFKPNEVEQLGAIVDRVVSYLVQSVEDNQLKPITFNGTTKN